MIKTYYSLTKPGIIYGNAITTIAGFLLASKGQVNFRLLVATLIGISLVIAAGCVLNNLFDRGIDSRMERTKNRALAIGAVSKLSAIIYAVVLGLIGVMVLSLYTNLLTTLIALVGFIVYVGFYTPLKHRSGSATPIGSIAGAAPIVVGYCAVSNRFDLGALLLFAILVTWQMPHFYAIAIRRLDEYRAAGIPILPLKNGVWLTKITMLVYIAGFIVATSLLTVFHYTGLIYLGIALVLGLSWLVLGIQGLKKNLDDKIWARKMFLLSLLILATLSLTISVDSFIK